MLQNRIGKYIYLTLGSVSLLLGIIGAFLPLLPTTVFLLMAAFFYERGSERFHNWLINHRVFGPPIVDWRRHQVIRTPHKMLATFTMLIGAYFVYSRPNIPLWVQVLYSLIIAGVLSFIWTRRGQRI